MDKYTDNSRRDFNMDDRQRKDLSLDLPSTNKLEAEQSEKEDPCGFGLLPLWCLRRFATPKWFLTVIGFFVLIQSMMVSGITSSVITTIEKRYGFRSAESGLVVSAFDIGSLVVVVFISYFGGRGHRPGWVGVGAVIVAVGAILFTLPHFIISPYEPSVSVVDTPANALCVANSSNVTDVLCEAQEANSLYLFLFVLSNMVMGIGSTPIYTLGSTYIYDNVPKDDASLYISILYAIGAIGPAAGYLFGGLFLTFYIDLGSYLSSDDPGFLGAWWLGYLVCAGLIFSVSIFLLLFPRKLPTPTVNSETSADCVPATPVSVTTVTESDVTEDSLDPSMISFGANLKELPKALLSLLSNAIYMCVTCAATLEFSIVTAFLTFVPKYLQSHFNADIVTSSIMTGAILVPSAGTGILLGGYIIKRLRLNMTGCAQTALLSNLLSVMLFLSVFFISCETDKLVGVTAPNIDPDGLSVSNSILSSCNADCACDDTSYSPICYHGLSYYNPCYAGCEATVKDNFTQTFYTNCSCLPSLNGSTSVFAEQGICERDCGAALAPFLFCLFLVTMATVCAHTPSLMVTYRCVKDEERPFAAGVQFLFFRALAYIPAPIYFGTAIDQACLLWEGGTGPCADSGSCLFYDADKFRYIFFGVAFSCKVLAAVFMFLSWLLCRREYSPHTHTTRWRRLRRKKQLKKINLYKSSHSGGANGVETFTSLPEGSTDQAWDAPRPPASDGTTSTEVSHSSICSSTNQVDFVVKENRPQVQVISSKVP